MNELDNIDVDILNLVQRDAQLTHKEIAEKANRSLSAIQVRVKKLQEIGIIKKCVMLLDRHKVGKKLAVFVDIKLTNCGLDALMEFQRNVVEFDEVMECYQTSGIKDFLLKIVVSDINAYNLFLVDKLSRVPHVGNVESSFVISETKYETAYRIPVPK